MSGSPSQGAWECRHGVDGRDECEECRAPGVSDRDANQLDHAVIRTHLGSHAPDLLPAFDRLVEVCRAAKETLADCGEDMDNPMYCRISSADADELAAAVARVDGDA